MNRLPKTIQNEISEFAHGNKTYWRKQFNESIYELEAFIGHIQYLILFGFNESRSKTILKTIRANPKELLAISFGIPQRFGDKKDAINEAKKMMAWYHRPEAVDKTSFLNFESIEEFTLIKAVFGFLHKRGKNQSWIYCLAIDWIFKRDLYLVLRNFQQDRMNLEPTLRAKWPYLFENEPHRMERRSRRKIINYKD